MADRVIRIGAILVLWDECQHVSLAQMSLVSAQFCKSFRNALAVQAKMSMAHIPFVFPATNSVLFPETTTFLHDGAQLPYRGKNKDLAILKWCSSGLVDDLGNFHHVVLDAENSVRPSGKDFPIVPLTDWCVLFVTGDEGSGMNAAQDWLAAADDSGCSVVTLFLPQEYASSKHRARYAGEKFGVEIAVRVVRSTEEAWEISIPDHRREQQ